VSVLATPKQRGLAIRIAVTLSVLGYLASKLDWPELGRQLAWTDPTPLSVACAVFGAALFAAILRWWLLLKVQGILLPLGKTVQLAFAGLFFNLFLFSAIGGDLLKAIYLMRYAPGNRARAALSIVMDRAFGLLVLVGIVVFVMPWQFRFLMERDEMRTLAYALSLLLAVGGTVAILIALLPRRLVPTAAQRVWKRIPYIEAVESVLVGFRQHGTELVYTLGALGFSLCSTALTALAGCWIAKALHIDLTFLQMAVILSVVICATSLPISIGGHGIREGTFLLMFTIFGIAASDGAFEGTRELAVLFSVSYFSLHLLWGGIGGLVYLRLQHEATGPASSGRTSAKSDSGA
jgi:glycosyltransferase 2 family protein